MATNEDNNLIGYDPLAWMEVENDKDEDEEHSLIVDFDSEVKLAGQLISDNKTGMPKNYPEDLTDDVEDESLSVLHEELGVMTNDDGLQVDEFNDKSVMVMINDSVDDCSEPELIAIQQDDSSEEIIGSQIDLDSTLNIQHVVKLHETLKLCVAMHDQIEINASDVASIDTATLQLLVSLKISAVKLNKQVSIIYPSPRFIESAQLLGLLEVLDVHDA
ncbi:MAG: STAS domain-containing protein [Methylobacter sp.]|nr:STAS domain-containing protein [Methylobacter sp.]